MQSPLSIEAVSSIAEFVQKWNTQQSFDFMSPESREARGEYVEKHPTLILVFKCMDGRIDLSHITGVPSGVFKPYRNIGGIFDLGWPLLSRIVIDQVREALNRRRKVLVLITYHYSKGHVHRGCAGHNHDTDAAYCAARRLQEQFAQVFDHDFNVYPIVAAVETDCDELQFHPKGEGERLRVADILNEPESKISGRIKALYPDMGRTLRKDLLPLVLGNCKYVLGLRRRPRAEGALVHCESIVAVGTGFDWLRRPNTALIVGPYAIRWQKAVVTAGRITLQNLREGRIPEEKGVLLLVSSPFFRVGMEKRAAVLKAHALADESLNILKIQVPELIPHLSGLTCILDSETRLLHVLQHDPAFSQG